MSKKQKIIEVWEHFLWMLRKRKLERLEGFQFRTGQDDQGRVFVEIFTPGSLYTRMNSELVGFDIQYEAHVHRLAATFYRVADALAEAGRRLGG